MELGLREGAGDGFCFREDDERPSDAHPTARGARTQTSWAAAELGRARLRAGGLGRAIARLGRMRKRSARMGRDPYLLLGLGFLAYTVKFVNCFTHFQKHFL